MMDAFLWALCLRKQGPHLNDRAAGRAETGTSGICLAAVVNECMSAELRHRGALRSGARCAYRASFRCRHGRVTHGRYSSPPRVAQAERQTCAADREIENP